MFYHVKPLNPSKIIFNIYHAKLCVIRVTTLFKFLKSVYFWQCYGPFNSCNSFLVKSRSEPPSCSLSMSVNFLITLPLFKCSSHIWCSFPISMGVISMSLFVHRDTFLPLVYRKFSWLMWCNIHVSICPQGYCPTYGV